MHDTKSHNINIEINSTKLPDNLETWSFVWMLSTFTCLSMWNFTSMPHSLSRRNDTSTNRALSDQRCHHYRDVPWHLGNAVYPVTNFSKSKILINRHFCTVCYKGSWWNLWCWHAYRKWVITRVSSDRFIKAAYDSESTEEKLSIEPCSSLLAPFSHLFWLLLYEKW